MPCSTHALNMTTIFARAGTGPVEKRFRGQNRPDLLSWKNGKVATTDGPYAETKEQLGGILMLEARDMNHAVRAHDGQHPAHTLWQHFRGFGQVGDMSEIMKASEQRRQRTPRDEDRLTRSSSISY